jgi:hypothetical protein
MTQDAGNILIAAFEERKFYGRWPISSYGDGTYNSLPDMYYHERWDWLMPVIEKISRIRIEWEDPEYNDTYYPRTFGMLSPSGNPMVRINANQVFEAPTLIEAAWLAVVDFIQWYNEKTNENK